MNKWNPIAANTLDLNGESTRLITGVERKLGTTFLNLYLGVPVQGTTQIGPVDPGGLTICGRKKRTRLIIARMSKT